MGCVVSSVTLRGYVSRKNIITQRGNVCGVWRLLWVYYTVWSEGIEVLVMSTRNAHFRDVLRHKLFHHNVLAIETLYHGSGMGTHL